MAKPLTPEEEKRARKSHNCSTDWSNPRIREERGRWISTLDREREARKAFQREALARISVFMPTPVEGYVSDSLLLSDIDRLGREKEQLKSQLTTARQQLDEINTPEIGDFLKSVELEAKHQRLRWPSEHDAGKKDSDWFWLVGYLAGKVITPGIPWEKKVHHIVTTAAACLNWYAAKTGSHNKMRPGIEPPKALVAIDGSKE